MQNEVAKGHETHPLFTIRPLVSEEGTRRGLKRKSTARAVSDRNTIIQKGLGMSTVIIVFAVSFVSFRIWRKSRERRIG